MTWQPIIETCGPTLAVLLVAAAALAACMRANSRFPGE